MNVVEFAERPADVDDDVVQITCDTCAVRFAVPAPLHWRYGKIGRALWCPNGHLVGSSYSEPVTQQVERLQAIAAELYTELWLERNAHKATHRSLVDLRHRIAQGRCPVCEYGSTHLAGHMRKHHPTYESEDV